MTLPTRRAIMWAAVTYLLLIVVVATPRVVGANWRSVMSPRDMRNLEGFPVQWEAFLVLRSLRAMSSDVAPGDIVEWYSTDEYRATLPTYFAAIVAQVTKSYVIGITAAELAWWWIGALAVFVLARTFVSAPAAYCAGILTCASPLGVGHVGSAHLHTASSLSLSVFLVIAWRILHSDSFSLLSKTVMYGCCLYLSSITYTYQWFLAPFFIVVTAAPRLVRERMIASVVGIGIFLVIRWASYFVLFLGGLEVHTHQNDPLRVILSRLSEESAFGSSIVSSLWAMTMTKAAAVSVGTFTSYHWIVVVSAALGASVVREARFAVATGTAVILSFIFGAIYDIAWVLMSGYPFVYALASHGMAEGSRIISLRVPFLNNNPRAPVALLCGCTAFAVIATNLDLVGDASFAIGWWRWWYTPH
jgi:hypothetical protein